MVVIKKIFLFCIVIIVSVFSLIYFRTIPSSKLWSGYRIVYVDSNVDNNIVFDIFEKAGCDNIITLENQYFPLLLSENSPELSIALSSVASSDYIEKRNVYFFDRTNKYKLYYVPDIFLPEAEIALQKLKLNNIKAGIDTQSSYPFLIPSVCVLFAIILFYFSSNKFLFFLSSLIPLLFSVCMPFYPIAACVCLVLYMLFFVFQFWKRKGAISIIKKNIFVILFFISSLIVAILTSITSAFMFLFVILGTSSIVFLYKIIEDSFDKKYNINFLFIKSAKQISIFQSQTIKACIFCTSSIFLLLAISLFSNAFIYADSPSKSTRLQLPSAYTGSISNTFPSLDEYVIWCWNTKTMPYRSLNNKDAFFSKTPKYGDTFVFPRYTDTKDGIIQKDNIMIFDKQFYDDTISQIDDLPYPALEKLMKAQGEMNAGWAFISSGSISFRHIILVLFALCIPLSLLIRSKIK